MTGRIVGVKVQHQLGELVIDSSNTESELLAAAAQGQRGPNGWDLSALGVAIAAAGEIKTLQAQVESLTAICAGLAKVASAAGYPCDLHSLIELAAEPEPDPEPRVFDLAGIAAEALKPGGLKVVSDYEPDDAELQADYERRLAKARNLAHATIGWSELCAQAWDPRTAPADLAAERRIPTPAELRTIEAWINRNAKAKGPL